MLAVSKKLKRSELLIVPVPLLPPGYVYPGTRPSARVRLQPSEGGIHVLTGAVGPRVQTQGVYVLYTTGACSFSKRRFLRKKKVKSRAERRQPT